MGAAHVRQQRGAVHPGHLHVRDHHVGRFVGQRRERGIAAGREVDPPRPPVAIQRLAQALEQVRLIVDDQYALGRWLGGRRFIVPLGAAVVGSSGGRSPCLR